MIGSGVAWAELRGDSPHHVLGGICSCPLATAKRTVSPQHPEASCFLARAAVTLSIISLHDTSSGEAWPAPCWTAPRQLGILGLAAPHTCSGHDLCTGWAEPSCPPPCPAAPPTAPRQTLQRPHLPSAALILTASALQPGQGHHPIAGRKEERPHAGDAQGPRQAFTHISPPPRPVACLQPVRCCCYSCPSNFTVVGTDSGTEPKLHSSQAAQPLLPAARSSPSKAQVLTIPLEP